MTPLSDRELILLRSERRAVLATIAPDGRARLVPIAYAFAGTAQDPVLYSPLDDKPKSVSDPRDLARVRDIEARPRVSVLVDRWSEDWTELAWIRLHGDARLIGFDDDRVEHAGAVHLLRDKYAQYATHALERRPVIRISVDMARSWWATP